jgi:hypothetical protein
MVKEQLIIEGVTIPIDKGISTVLTFSVKDIQQPDKVKSSFSKTIKLPGSKAINDKLNFIFEVNSDSTFNPNLKLDAVYYQNDIAVFSGFIQLKDIIKKDYNQVEYSVVLFGETANIFRELGNKFLNDAGMNWSNLDHDYTRVNQSNSWDNSYLLNGVATPFQYGAGYVYPMINYGNDTDISEYKVTEMFPAVYAKECIDRMFADAGYTYFSPFLNGSVFKHLVIPFNGKEFIPTQVDLSPRRVQANTPLFLASGTNNFTLNSATYPANSFAQDTLRLSNEVLDANNQYNSTTGVLTVGANGLYRVSFDAILQMETTPQAGGAAAGDLVANGDANFVNSFGIYVNGVFTNAVTSYTFADNLTPAVTYQTANPTTYPDADFITPAFPIVERNYNPPNRYQVNAEIQLEAGDLITIEVASAWQFKTTPENGGAQVIFTSLAPYYDVSSTPNTPPPPLLKDEYDADFKIIISNANLYLDVVGSPYVEGDSIDMATCIPDKVKQRDFLTSIIKMFNLYMIPDPENPKNMIILERRYFYTGDVVDWSSKLDYSKEHNLTPTAVTNKQKYVYTYKKDADYYNKKYEASWLDIYGTRNIYLDNDFNKSEQKTELIFSSTPLVGQLTNDRIISTIVDVDASFQQKTVKSNIRILYYGGLKPSVINWNHSSLSGDILRETYPYVGHFDDPYNPALDINFGLPKEIYYDSTYGNITITDANLYNLYHRNELEQITNKDSKIFKGYFLLNPVDIANLSFRSSYWFENEYWILYKVMYSSSIYQPSKCEFLKFKSIPEYNPDVRDLTGGSGTIGDEDLPDTKTDTPNGGNLVSSKSVSISGSNNFVDRSALYIDILGDNNKVSTNSKNITIKGSNNIIYPDVENVTLIDTNNVTVTESNVTYINGEIKGGGSVVTINSNITADESVGTYLCDTSTGNITINLPTTATVGKVWHFKKISIDGQIRINSLTSIDGLPNLYIYALNNSYSIQFDGINYKII